MKIIMIFSDYIRNFTNNTTKSFAESRFFCLNFV